MDSRSNPLPPERNPRTHAEHKREVFWQITLPLLIGVLLILAAIAAIIFSSIQPVTDLQRWADVSLIWLILPSLVISLLGLIVLVGLVFAVTFLLHRIPSIARTIQLYFELAREKINQLSNKLTDPFVRLNGFWAAVRRATQLGKKKVHEL